MVSILYFRILTSKIIAMFNLASKHIELELQEAHSQSTTKKLKEKRLFLKHFN